MAPVRAQDEGIVPDVQPKAPGSAEYDPEFAGNEEPGSQPYNINAAAEDAEAERSEASQSVSQGT
jgi:hypothetical protein